MQPPDISLQLLIGAALLCRYFDVQFGVVNLLTDATCGAQ